MKPEWVRRESECAFKKENVPAIRARMRENCSTVIVRTISLRQRDPLS